MITIRKLVAKDARLLAKIARQTYSEHFEYLWEDEGKDYIAKHFNEEILESELGDADILYFAGYFDDEIAGYLKLRPQNTLSMFGESDAFEIERIYLTKRAQGKGIGKKMMNLALEIAEKMRKETIWLKVMDGNERSIKFYERFGFSKCGAEQLNLPKVKTEHRGMFVMRKFL